ncbi:TetR/AcrR family transcriptional regulator, partial [Weissella cibaria]
MSNWAADIFIDTLYFLLRDYEFQKITIDQIVEKSGLSKSTFYRCYDSKYALLESLYDKTVTSVALKTNKEM